VVTSAAGFPLDQTCLDELLELALHGARPGAHRADDLAQVEALVRSTEQECQDVTPHRAEEHSGDPVGRGY